MSYPATTWVEVNIEAVRSNVQAVKAYIRRHSHSQHSPELIAVIKADAYGHGAIPVAHALQAEVSMFAIATIEEAIELREAGIDTPILVLFNPLPDSAEAIVRYQLTPAVCETTFCKALSDIGRKLNKRVKVHVNVDTGMHRSGLQYTEAVRFVQWLTSLEGIEIEGLFTHFATADDADGSYAHLQLKRFKSICAELARLNLQPPIVHVANSAGTIAIPKSYFDAVRIGLILYGIFPSPDFKSVFSKKIHLKPALSWKTRVICTHEAKPSEGVSYGLTYKTTHQTWLATLRVGYADGYPRSLSNLGEVLIDGKRRPIVGRICMDVAVAKIHPHKGVAVGDEVVLIGKQGEEEITVDQVATQARTISYEILTGIGKRVPRIYVD